MKQVVLAPPPKPRFHVVKEGQTLTEIALEFYGAAGENELGMIHEANRYKMPNRNMIWPGLKLRIPRLEKSKSTDVTTVLSLAGPRTYTVMPGDTLSEISSKKLGTMTRWREIRRLNSNQLPTEDTQLRPGMVLKLPAVPKASGLRIPQGHEDIWR